MCCFTLPQASKMPPCLPRDDDGVKIRDFLYIFCVNKNSNVLAVLLEITNNLRKNVDQIRKSVRFTLLMSYRPNCMMGSTQ